MSQTIHKPPLILLVDDILQNLQVLSESLREEGFHITGANGAQKAFKLLERVRPDLILCDIMMPEIDGYEFVQSLRAQPDLADIPVIFLTAKKDAEDIVHGFEVGAVDYVTKPFSIAELLARVKMQLDLKTAHDTIVSQLKTLEELNTEKDNILNIATHDLKNPLASIMLMAEMMQLRQGLLKPEKIAEYADTIYNDANRMLLIISNLLDVNKFESGRIQAQFTRCELTALLKRFAQDYENQARHKSIDFQLQVPQAPVYVQSDPHFLNQLVDNLVSNALKFTSSQKQVCLRLRDEAQAVVLEIQDQGPGFSAQDQRKMFQKFARLSARPTADENSTGLGLAIVKRLSEILEITLDFETGSTGTTFRLGLKSHE